MTKTKTQGRRDHLLATLAFSLCQRADCPPSLLGIHSMHPVTFTEHLLWERHRSGP
jgi:hypothetical protein